MDGKRQHPPSPLCHRKDDEQHDGHSTQDFKDGNRIEFVVLKSATKQQIKEAFEAHFDVKVEKVRPRSPRRGSATILLAEGYSAEDIE